MAIANSSPRAMSFYRPDRRALLIGGGAALCGLAGLPVWADPLAGPPGFAPLGRVAAAHGLRFGFAIDPRPLATDPSYAAFVAEQATIVVPENVLKWETIHPAANRYNFAPGDVIAAFAKAHRIAMRGHTLCWHRALPDWVKQTVTPKNAEAVLVDHIHQVAGHYRGMIHSWDVANEAINVSDGLSGGWRDGFWHRALGPAFVDIAFHAAHEADPGATLCYNDYGLEADTRDGLAKRTAVLAMLRGLRERGVPVGALGIQSHLRAGGADTFGSGLAQFLHEVKALGLAVYITELDVDDSHVDPAHRDAIVASVYKRYLDLVLGSGAVTAVLTWGVWDAAHRTAATPKQSDVMAERPLLFAPGGSLKDASWVAEHCFARV